MYFECWILSRALEKKYLLCYPVYVHKSILPISRNSHGLLVWPVTGEIATLSQDMSHEDEEVQHGDYNIGMNVSPGPYLSDSDLSVTSIELSPAQVSWWAGSGRVRSGQVGSGRVRSGQVGSGRVRSDPDGLGQVGSGRVRSCQVGSGRVRSGQVGSGRARSGQVGSGRVRSGQRIYLHQ